VKRPPEPARNAVALVASAGGVIALGEVLADLPADLPAALIVVMHLLPEHPSHLSEILARKTMLRVKEAQGGDVLEPGCVYVAPPDAHLLVQPDGTLSLGAEPPVRHLRPSGDVLLESLAACYDGNCLAVVLTGLGTDGAVGARAVKQAGGAVLAQDEATSAYFGMPKAAIAAGAVDRTLPLDQIPAAVVDFVSAR
jgi:two-component system, chemotaxis family, protein-glutamate methylesterase/glutaminase